jgi:hypothetical protein
LAAAWRLCYLSRRIAGASPAELWVYPPEAFAAWRLCELFLFSFFFSQRRKDAKKLWSTPIRRGRLCGFATLRALFFFILAKTCPPRRIFFSQRNTSLHLLKKDEAGIKVIEYR